MGKKYFLLLSCMTFLLLLVFCFMDVRALFGAQKHEPLSARVIMVHDGDTVSVILRGREEKVRLIGIDAPELGQKPWGRKAKKHLEEILSRTGWITLLEFDVQERDKYGRLLAYLWTRDKKLINLEMLKDGFAVLYTLPPNVKYVEVLRDGQHSARENDLGIWGRDGLRETPQEYRKEHHR
jgi:micrococcal nuclease